jgi:phage terminase Nu1 subunit (DNA packaging protein)
MNAPRPKAASLLQGYRKDLEDCRGQVNAYAKCINSENASLQEAIRETQKKHVDRQAALNSQWSTFETKRKVFEADSSRVDRLRGLMQRKARKVANERCDISREDLRKAMAIYEQTDATYTTLANTEKEHIEQSKARIAVKAHRIACEICFSGGQDRSCIQLSRRSSYPVMRHTRAAYSRNDLRLRLTEEV